jgi:hypothetical protein
MSISSCNKSSGYCGERIGSLTRSPYKSPSQTKFSWSSNKRSKEYSLADCEVVRNLPIPKTLRELVAEFVHLSNTRLPVLVRLGLRNAWNCRDGGCEQANNIEHSLTVAQLPKSPNRR